VEWSCPSRNAYTLHPTRRSWVAPTRRIMTNPGLKSVPIKAVTSYAFAGDADKALAAGYNGHVSRPYRRDPLGKSFPIWRKSSKVAFSHVAAQSHCTGMSQLALKSLLGATR
jgi:CheY-like chemotaxis protein